MSSTSSGSIDGELVYDNHGNRAKYMRVEGRVGNPVSIP